MDTGRYGACTLQPRGTGIPLVVVQELPREMDPGGTELRKGHRLSQPWSKLLMAL